MLGIVLHIGSDMALELYIIVLCCSGGPRSLALILITLCTITTMSL